MDFIRETVDPALANVDEPHPDALGVYRRWKELNQ